jgi:hypothetical protein
MRRPNRCPRRGSGLRRRREPGDMPPCTGPGALQPVFTGASRRARHCAAARKPPRPGETQRRSGIAPASDCHMVTLQLQHRSPLRER